MTAAIIITICILLLIAYLFDLTSAKTRIPSVLMLLFLGWLVQQVANLLKLKIPDLSPLLPILGTLGLVLIVLEGALELEFNKSKFSLIKKSLGMALLSIMMLSFLFAYLFMLISGSSLQDALINAIPFSVISSSIAIPSVRNQSVATKEFVIYESSLSDIIGIVFFNFIVLNTTINAVSFGYFGLEILIMTGISFIATLGLSLLLSKIDHHIKFVPIVILIILVYEISKVYNLPALFFILLFGIFLGNLDELKRFKWIQKLEPQLLNQEITKFKHLISEATFLVKTVFFILFGFLMQTSEILNAESFSWSLLIVASILIIRAILLKIFHFSLNPLLFIAPRGLINILLFISIVPAKSIGWVNKSMVVQVIFFSALVMMIGLIATKKKDETNQLKPQPEV